MFIVRTGNPVQIEKILNEYQDRIIGSPSITFAGSNTICVVFEVALNEEEEDEWAEEHQEEAPEDPFGHAF